MSKDNDLLVEKMNAVAEQAVANLAADPRTLADGGLSPDWLVLAAWDAACDALPGCEHLVEEGPDWVGWIKDTANENGRRKLRAAFERVGLHWPERLS